jgi:hypothetical protein
VRQAHELDELEEPLRCVLQPHGAATLRCGELETRERVDCHRICIDARDLAVDYDRCAVGKHSTDPVAQSRKVGATDRAADGEGDLVRPGCRHRKLGRPVRDNLIDTGVDDVGANGSVGFGMFEASDEFWIFNWSATKRTRCGGFGQ